MRSTLSMLQAALDLNPMLDLTSLFYSEFCLCLQCSGLLLKRAQCEPVQRPAVRVSSGSDLSLLRNGAQLALEEYIIDPQHRGRGRCFEHPSLCQCGPQLRAYSQDYACVASPCGSILQLWFGTNVDFSVGLPIEAAGVPLLSLWLCMCACVIPSAAVRLKLWHHCISPETAVRTITSKEFTLL